MHHLAALFLGVFTAGFTVSCATVPPPQTGWTGPETIGRIEHPAINESSGLARSHRAADVYWTHNDSGGEPVLYAIDGTGRFLGAMRVAGTTNIDWEDMASFELDGTAYLLVADVGDNLGRRTDCMLHIIREPDPADLNPARELTAEIAWQVPVAYPGGPRDCEGVAVDSAARIIYLISKRTKPPVVYQLPLRPDPTTPAPLAAVVGDLIGIPEPTGPGALLNVPWGRYRASPCAFDLSPDGRTAVVLTYGEVYLYERRGDATWSEAFAAGPLALAAHGLPQAESACFATDRRSVLVTTEASPAPLLSYRRVD